MDSSYTGLAQESTKSDPEGSLSADERDSAACVRFRRGPNELGAIRSSPVQRFPGKKFQRSQTSAQRLGFHSGALFREDEEPATMSARSSDASPINKEMMSRDSQPLGRQSERKLSLPERVNSPADDCQVCGVSLARGVPTVDTYAMAIYDKLHGEEMPNFLPHVRLDADGGLNKLEEIWNLQRIFWCFFLFGSIVFNVASLIYMDWALFTVFLEGQEHTVDEVREGDMQSAMKAELLAPGGDRATQADRELFFCVQDSATKLRIHTSAVVIASFDMLGICFFVLKIFWQLAIFAFSANEYKSYRSIHDFFSNTLPNLSVFSAIKLMGNVHPATIYTEYLYVIHESSCAGGCGVVFTTLWFVISRLICAAVAVQAFAVKVLLLASRFVNPSYSWVLRWGQVLALLNNCMGTVLFERVLQDRLFLFIFGGHDTDYQDDERALRNVYQCRLAKQIWIDYWAQGKRFKAIVLLATLDHYDLQALIIRDAEDLHGEGVSPILSRTGFDSRSRTFPPTMDG